MRYLIMMEVKENKGWMGELLLSVGNVVTATNLVHCKVRKVLSIFRLSLIPSSINDTLRWLTESYTVITHSTGSSTSLDQYFSGS